MRSWPRTSAAAMRRPSGCTSMSASGVGCGLRSTAARVGAAATSHTCTRPLTSPPASCWPSLDQASAPLAAPRTASTPASTMSSPSRRQTHSDALSQSATSRSPPGAQARWRTAAPKLGSCASVLPVASSTRSSPLPSGHCQMAAARVQRQRLDARAGRQRHAEAARRFADAADGHVALRIGHGRGGAARLQRQRADVAQAVEQRPCGATVAGAIEPLQGALVLRQHQHAAAIGADRRCGQRLALRQHRIALGRGGLAQHTPVFQHRQARAIGQRLQRQHGFGLVLAGRVAALGGHHGRARLTLQRQLVQRTGTVADEQTGPRPRPMPTPSPRCWPAARPAHRPPAR